MRRNSGIILNDRARGLACVAFAILAATTVTTAHAGTAAGTPITNVAAIFFSLNGTTTSITSNNVTIRVDEVLDVSLTPTPDSTVSIPTDLSGFGVPFLLTNGGNGTEAFTLTGDVAGQVLPITVAIDVDGNGAFDPAVDTVLPVTGVTPAIPSGATLKLLARFGTSPTAASVLSLHARAVTGSGARSTEFARRGDDGTDAIVGNTTASATASVPFVIGMLPATLHKSQAVLAPDGTASPISGATITYRLELTTMGGASLSEAELVDQIPAGTLYRAGSIRIDGAAASDAQDQDDARFDGAAIHIAFGNIIQPTTHVVTFQVTIQ
ncbi:MAG: proprotein convertase [Sphingomonadales bacterium]|nr:proprotein convertase [Sphingomonadales bacterium]